MRWAAIAFGAAVAWPGAALAADPDPQVVAAPPAAPVALLAPGAARPADADVDELTRTPGNYVHLFGTAEFGKGFRFNNPYRLATQLGSTPESVSLTASYLDLGLALTLGDPNGFQHGAALHLTFALAGVSQQVLTPSYALAYRPSSRLLAYGRLGPSIVLSPDPTIGFELAAGLGVFLTSRVALGGEIIGDLYYGAGTPQRGVTTYPILSGQLGLLVDYEVLP